MLVMGGLKSAGGAGSLVGQALTAQSITLTSTSPAGITFTDPNGLQRIVFANGGAYLQFVAAGGYLLYTGGFNSARASGSNAILLSNAGARIKFSEGGTTDYLSSDGSTTITAAGVFAAAGGLSCRSNSATLVLNVGSAGTAMLSVNRDYNTVYTGNSTTLEIGANGAIQGSNTAEPVTIRGDTTSPARAAFRIVPQDAEPTGASTVGDMYVTTAGVLKICTVAGTPGTWVSVGAQ